MQPSEIGNASPSNVPHELVLWHVRRLKIWLWELINFAILSLRVDLNLYIKRTIIALGRAVGALHLKSFFCYKIGKSSLVAYELTYLFKLPLVNYNMIYEKE